jgi:hypothetical protein
VTPAGSNELGRVTFINPGGSVERMMGGTLEESLGIPLHLYKAWNIRDFTLPTELARRGLDDPERLSRYPMRDDGLLVAWWISGEHCYRLEKLSSDARRLLHGEYFRGLGSIFIGKSMLTRSEKEC